MLIKQKRRLNLSKKNIKELLNHLAPQGLTSSRFSTSLQNSSRTDLLPQNLFYLVAVSMHCLY